MDKIYSRRKIDINFTKKLGNKRKIQKMSTVSTIFITALITARLVLNSIIPIIDKQCEIMSKSVSTKICNEQATIVMAKYKYDDVSMITKDSNGNITMISANIITINEIISDIAVKIQEELNKTENSSFKIKLGSFTGSKLLSGSGPDIQVKMSTIGSIDTNLKSDFTSQGINQVLHKIYLEIKCNVVVLTPFETMQEEITNQVLLAEAVIVGITPNTYYNFEGISSKDTITAID